MGLPENGRRNCSSLSIVWFVVYTLFPLSVFGQWHPVSEGVFDFWQRMNSIKLGQDHSVWIIVSHESELPKPQYPTVFRSLDSGKTWSRSVVQVAISEDFASWDIAPVDSTTAYIAASSAGMFITIDGGRSWNKVESYPLPCLFVHFFNESDGWAFSGRIRMTLWDEQLPFVQSVTADGGKTWMHIGGNEWIQPQGTSLPQRDTTELAGSWHSMNSGYDCNEQSIIIGMNHGTYWLSNDRGYNWERSYTPLADSGLVVTMVAMKDSNMFIVAGNFVDEYFSKISSRLPIHDLVSFGTMDGGVTWVKGSPEVGGASLEYIPGTVGAFVIAGRDNRWGGQGSAITTDLGSTWVRNDSFPIVSMAFADSSNGYGGYGNYGLPGLTGQIYRWGPLLQPVIPTKWVWWPWVLLIISAIIAFGVHNYRIRQVRRRSELALQLIELEKAALHAQMNPHFIFNSLNALQSYINNNEADNSNIFLSYFSKLIRGILKASDEKEIQLKVELELLESYLELEKIRFNKRFDYRITVDDDIDPEFIKLPSMITQPLIENAIVHGLSKTISGGLIELDYRLNDDQLIITVIDNGIGIYQSENRNDPHHKSVGLSNTIKRLKLLDEGNELRISEITDDQGKVIGTRIVQYVHLNIR